MKEMKMLKPEGGCCGGHGHGDGSGQGCHGQGHGEGCQGHGHGGCGHHE